jgi:ATP-dependent RNA helicase SUPV3L1/SUV3
LENEEIKNRNFMLLCGFEKFENIYVRIDILERLFMQIINSNSKNKKEIRMTPEMLNLLGCSKDSFKKLIKNMNYKIIEKENEIFFKYSPKKNIKKNKDKVIRENPFQALKNLNLG